MDKSDDSIQIDERDQPGPNESCNINNHAPSIRTSLATAVTLWTLILLQIITTNPETQNKTSNNGSDSSPQPNRETKPLQRII